MRIVIASRKSELARIQALAVGAALAKAHPALQIEYNFRESLGDKNLTDPLWKMPEKGVFTEDFYEDLVQGASDMVVHSWKDLPTEARDKTEIFATMPRADMRDLLLFKKSSHANAIQKKAIRFFSSSPRRAYNLSPFFKEHLPFIPPKIEFESVRGNVPTRIRKLLADPNIDGLIVAKAALDRLMVVPEVEKELKNALTQCLVMVLPLSANPTAAAQGALAIEVRQDREDIKKLLKPIHCIKTFNAVQKERDVLKGYGGGCHQKVGVSCLARSYGEHLFVRALTDGGLKVDRWDFNPSREFNFKAELQEIFPLNPKDSNWFEREFLDFKLPTGSLWIAKADALPVSVKLHEGQRVWTAGLQTWKTLAQRGIWVTGSNESLGEEEEMGLKALFPDDEWTKLTHTEGVGKFVATYKLTPKKEVPDLKGKKYFYWMSGSSFKRALELNPEIKNGVHACGPGHTHEVLKSVVGEAKVFIFPSHGHWLERLRK